MELVLILVLMCVIFVVGYALSTGSSVGTDWSAMVDDHSPDGERSRPGGLPSPTELRAIAKQSRMDEWQREESRRDELKGLPDCAWAARFVETKVARQIEKAAANGQTQTFCSGSGHRDRDKLFVRYDQDERPTTYLLTGTGEEVASLLRESGYSVKVVDRTLVISWR